MAIEDASEMAKKYLHEDGFFVRFGEDIKKESGKDFKFSYRKTSTMERNRASSNGVAGIEYILMEHSYPDGSGHYGMAKVNHDNKTAVIYDSMTDDKFGFRRTTPLITQSSIQTVYENVKWLLPTTHGWFCFAVVCQFQE